MKLALYQKAVKRTLPDLGDSIEFSTVDPDLRKTLSLKLNLAHMALGISSELSELEECLSKNVKGLDLVNLGEEIGDMLWYACNWANLLDITLETEEFENGYDYDSTMNRIMFYGGLLSDISKRFLAYNHSLSLQEEMRLAKANKEGREEFLSNKDILIRYINSCFNYCIDMNIDIEKVMEANITKLYVRYKDKFTADEALTRDLEKELKILQENL